MRVGIPKEIKILEKRVGMVPAGVKELVQRGHEVLIETQAGMGIGLDDNRYTEAGAKVVGSPEAIFADSDLIVKVKEPQLSECAQLSPAQTLFTYLHLAADPAQAEALVTSGATAIAYETVTAADHSLPLLTPMSEVAGRMSIQVGAHALEQVNGGMGVLLGGVPGVDPAHVVILGGGVAGSNAAEMAVGLGAHVTLVDRSLPRLRELSARFDNRIKTAYSTQEKVSELVADADLVIGSVLVPGASAPKLVTADMVRGMKSGSVLVDIAIDQGGCFETSRPTNHQEPTFIQDGVVHYCVTNMPGAVPRTSTLALCNATLPYVIELANLGTQSALENNKHLAQGLNVRKGEIVHPAVKAALAALSNA
ncbi:MAG: alanine dehydrogenase [Deltaproteobacteria bacterium]|nr:alanine dehydrogenase [Deltaproteobacteria bacterium]